MKFLPLLLLLVTLSGCAEITTTGYRTVSTSSDRRMAIDPITGEHPNGYQSPEEHRAWLAAQRYYATQTVASARVVDKDGNEGMVFLNNSGDYSYVYGDEKHTSSVTLPFKSR
jgi:aminoglycoside/choline kinase family phosphotransferase